MDAIIYCRMSKDRTGAGLGIERQRQDCAELAKKLGWNIVAVYEDNDISAYSGKARPGYLDLVRDLEAGRAQSVITWHADRLHRSPTELEGFIDLCTRHAVTVHTVKAGTLDLSTPTGQMTARIVGAVSRHEIDHARQRMTRAHAQNAAAGKWSPRRRPYGYVRETGEAVPEEAARIQQAAQDVLAGLSLHGIARAWNEQGLVTTTGLPWTNRAIKIILISPRHAGYAVYRGEVVGDGDWDAIIDRDTHHALRALLTDPARRQNVTNQRASQGTGVYRCGRCGAPMWTTRTADGRGGTYRAYKCSATPHLSRRGDTLDEYIDGLVIGHLSGPDARLVLDSGEGVDVGALQTRRMALDGRLDELASLFADGALSSSQLSVGSGKLRAQIDDLDAQLAASSSLNPLTAFILGEGEVRDRWPALPTEARGAVIDALMTVTVMPGGAGRTGFQADLIDIEWRT